MFSTNLSGLTASGNLYLLANRSVGNLPYTCVEISYNVTSYIVHEDQFIITTLNTHQMQVIPIDAIDLDAAKLDTNLVYHRRIENGATLLATSDISAIFQMPRGNVEKIQPRPLVVVQMRTLMDQGRFQEAFQLVRTNRVNMNLLYDDDFKRFEAI